MPKEVNIDETKVFTCGKCGKPIMYRLPRRLKGVFVHFGCHNAPSIPQSAIRTPHSNEVSR